MKRVSFEVAKAIKEAGYPQNKNNQTAVYPIRGEFKGIPCGYNESAPDRDRDSVVAPTYLDVWIWLWREKRVPIQIDYSFTGLDENINDPEEAIISAIEYLVENKNI